MDAGELGKAFLTPGMRPARAASDYLLVPVRSSGAFHPKIIALLSANGMAFSVGSQNLTEAGLSRNSEICFGAGLSPSAGGTSIAEPALEYILGCMAEVAPGNAALGVKVTNKLLGIAKAASIGEEGVAFVGSSSIDSSLFEKAFEPNEVLSAKRILVVGPYFDRNFSFLSAIQKRAAGAKITVAIQPEFAAIANLHKLPSGITLRNANALFPEKTNCFNHAKALVIEGKNYVVMAIGSANPSAPAWLGNRDTRNHEAIVVLRGNAAINGMKDCGFARLWNAPVISSAERKEIGERATKEGPVEPDSGYSFVRGRWRGGVVECPVEIKLQDIKSLHRLVGDEVIDIHFGSISVSEGILRFSSADAGVFHLSAGRKSPPVLIIATSEETIAAALVSTPAAKLIDELSAIDGEVTPTEEFMDLFEKVCLRPENEDRLVEQGIGLRRDTKNSSISNTGVERQGPRGISIETGKRLQERSRTALNLDVSSILAALLRDLNVAAEERNDPLAGEEDDTPTDLNPRRRNALQSRWDEVVRAVRPRVTRLINQLERRLAGDESPMWKYERTTLVLAFLKFLRKIHPEQGIVYVGFPERLVEVSQIRRAFGAVIGCWFARKSGVAQVLDIDSADVSLGRALLLWAAYESGLDASSGDQHDFDMGSRQNDRLNAIVAAVAACASKETNDRARRELFDRGKWKERHDRFEAIEMWFNRHSQIGYMLSKYMREAGPALPTLNRVASKNDLVVWKSEPRWPRLMNSLNGRAAILTDVGDTPEIKVHPQAILPIDIAKMGLASFFPK